MIAADIADAYRLRLLLAAGLDHAIIPIDEFLPAMYLEHPRADVRARFPPRLTALATAQPQAPPDYARH